MKTRIFLLTLWLTLAVTLQAQTYNQLWKNVEQMEKKDLPKSVIAEAQRIYDKAKKERNVPQMMKAYLTMMNYRGQISPDSISVDIKSGRYYYDMEDEKQDVVAADKGFKEFFENESRVSSFSIRVLMRRAIASVS